MIRPASFGFNHQTSVTNSFQKVLKLDNVSEKAVEEFDRAVAKLEEVGIKVQVFEDDRLNLPDAIFPNNWIAHHPNGELVTFPMQSENRRAEVREDIIEWCKLNLPVDQYLDLTSKAEEKVYLEGTGSIVYSHENSLAFGCVSPRTHLELFSSFSKQIGYTEVSFESVDVKGDQIYHTNVMMSVGHKVILVCLESLENTLERSMLLKTLKSTGKDVIDLSYQQMNSFAANALEVAAENGEVYYVMSKTAHDSLDPDQVGRIEKHSKILVVEIPVIELVGGGGIRCMMAGMFNYPR